jgi:hypothetical protein
MYGYKISVYDFLWNMYEYIYIYISQTITAFFSQALDYLAIGVHELANMSERRIAIC